MAAPDNTVLNPVAKRRPPAAGMGRKKGVPNNLTRDLKAMIEGALEDAGGRTYLARQADENPAAFMALVGKILPKEIKAEVAATHVIQRLTPEQLAGIVEAVTGGKR